MSGQLVLRCGAFPEINPHDFRRWIAETYFKLPSEIHPYLDRFDVDVEIRVDETTGKIIIRADIVDVTDERSGLCSEDLKRELREISRGNMGRCKR